MPQGQPSVQEHRPRHLWILVHSQKGRDATIYPFWYEPSKNFPYPSTVKIIAGLKLHVDIDSGDTVYIEEVPPHTLPVASFDKGHGGATPPGWLGLGPIPAEREEETQTTQTQMEPQP